MAAVHWSPLVLLLCACAWADIVMHNPRGSNNRLNEPNSERRNNNRLFDSQNNDRGGYNVGDATDEAFGDEDGQYNMKYFQSCKDGGKTFLEIEWTNQHGCGDVSSDDGEGAGAQKRYCDQVMQYMCQPDDVEGQDDFTKDTLRNGDNTGSQAFSQPSNQRSIVRNTKTNNVKTDRGLHESWDWYKQCYVREANGGLFVADQELKNNKLGYTAAIHTRQEKNGGRSGYECNEERDYWPYWQVSPWVDAAVLTSDLSNCEKYKEASTNKETKGRCFQEQFINVRKHDKGKQEVLSKFIDQVSCEGASGEWVQVSSYLEKATGRTQDQCTGDVDATSGLQYAWRVPFDVTYVDNEDEDTFSSPAAECLVLAPELDCQQTDYSRMNHQGNTKGGQMMRYKWEMPYFPSGDTKRCVFRIRYNISTFDYAPFETFSDQNGEDSPVQGNPDVDVIADNGRKLNLQIALNTDQYGRTFQDRSHVFKLMPREGDEMMGKDIYNLNVRGRRGNIVQTFPSVEYDFTPNDLKLTTEDLVHIQWTGSNTNPNDAGQGTAKTDRSNLVPVNDPSLNVPIEAADVNSIWANAEVVWTYFGKTDITPGDLYVNLASSGYYRCKNTDECTEDEHADFILSTTTNNENNLLNNELNNAPASYGGVVLRFTDAGSYWFMCTRNNNFTNRSQKGGFTVSAAAKKRGVVKMEQEKDVEAELEEAVKRLLKTLDH